MGSLLFYTLMIHLNICLEKPRRMKKFIVFSITIFLFMGCATEDVAPVKITSPQFEIGYAKTILMCHKVSDTTFQPLWIDIKDLNEHLLHGDYQADPDEDGYTVIGACTGSGDDCDDKNPIVNPGAEEICGNGRDDNCDGQVDEGCVKIPVLLTPAQNDTLDNGCKNKLDTISWYFDWEEVPGATSYHIYIKNDNASLPVIDRIIGESDFSFSGTGYIVLTTGWYCKVRAMVNGILLEWSEKRRFVVEPLGTDC